MTAQVVLNALELPTFPSLLGRYEVRIDGRRYCTVRCTAAQATRLARAIRKDSALPAITKQLRRT